MKRGERMKEVVYKDDNGLKEIISALEESGALDAHDKQIRAEVWEDIEKIINGMSNPIQTMEIIIEKLKEKNNESKC